jgi:hypothetical protein
MNGAMITPHTVLSQANEANPTENPGYSPNIPAKKGKKGNLLGNLGAYGREHMTEKDWDAKFELLLSEDLIDLPPHLEQEHLYFTDPNQMDEIFGELEEQNLYLIHRKQEIEHALETQTH